MAGRSGLGPITHFDPSRLETRIAGEVKGFNPDQYIPAKEVRRMDRFTHFALAATAQALEQAALEITDTNRDDIGVLIGSGIGGLQTLNDQILVLEHKGPRRINPFAIPMVVIDLAAGQVSIQFGLQGPNFAVVSACSTSAHAIGEGAEIIRRGDAKAMVVGGTEAPITEIGIATFGAMRALSTHNEEPQKASRPFDAERDGFVMGEGGGGADPGGLRLGAGARGAHPGRGGRLWADRRCQPCDGPGRGRRGRGAGDDQRAAQGRA